MINKQLRENISLQKQYRILIVEDQSTDIVGPYRLFHHMGYNVSLAFDGAEALDALRRKAFDLVILDWNMPFVSGEAFLKNIENERVEIQQNGPLKVIIYSGTALDLDDFRSANNYRIQDIWQKPMSVADLSKRLRRLQRR